MNKQVINNKGTISKKKLLGVKRFFVGIAAVVIVVLIIGFSYEKYGSYSDEKKYNPVGKIIEVNGHNMHIFAKGEGGATVVFASGWGIPCPYADFYPVHNEISKHTRIAVYDRPGYGWSDVAKTPREIDTITKELHELLEKSGEKGPYILIGHSLASLELIRFTQMYKEEVKGIVMIDAGNPEYYSKEDINDSATSNSLLMSVLEEFGGFRLLFNVPSFYSSAYLARNNFALVPKDLKELDKAMYLKNMINKNKNDENKNIKINASKVVSNDKLGNVPLRILTSESEATANPKWKNSQDTFKNWSSDSKQMIVTNTNHNIQQYAPEAINKQILEILNTIK